MLLSNMTGVKEQNISTLQQYYPDIAFAYMCSQLKRTVLLDQGIDFLKWLSGIPLDQIEVLYLYGIEGGLYYQALLPWLKEKKQRVLILLESSIDHIDLFLSSDLASQILVDPQVRFLFIQSDQDVQEVLKQCCLAIPSNKVELVATRRYQKKYRQKIEELQGFLYRNALIFYSWTCESLHYHFLLENIVPNIRLLDRACYVNQLKGAFENIPAIICGAGPSLDGSLQHLKDMDAHALIFAGGSAISALTTQGIRPNIAIALDPNQEEYIRLKTAQAFETPLFFAPRLQKQVLDLAACPLAYMSTGTGGSFESWIEQRLGLDMPVLGMDLSHEALSVTTMAVSLARYMGCSPIIFCGVDLAYTDKKRYSQGVMSCSAVLISDIEKKQDAADKLIIKKDREGNSIYSLVRWVMEAEVLGDYARQHPDVEFFNATSEGLPIPDVAYRPLSEILADLSCNAYDVQGMLHRAMQDSCITPCEKLQTLYEELKGSLLRATEFITDILNEIEQVKKQTHDPTYPLMSAKRILLDMDLQDELAYHVLLENAAKGIEKIFLRGYWTEATEDTEEYRRCLLEKDQIFYTHLLELAIAQHRVFANC